MNMQCRHGPIHLSHDKFFVCLVNGILAGRMRSWSKMGCRPSKRSLLRGVVVIIGIICSVRILHNDWFGAFYWNRQIFVCWVSDLLNEPRIERSKHLCVNFSTLTGNILLFSSHATTKNRINLRPGVRSLNGVHRSSHDLNLFPNVDCIFSTPGARPVRSP